MINTLFSGNEISKERNHYICIAAIVIDSVLRIKKKKLSSSLFRIMQIRNKKNRVSKCY